MAPALVAATMFCLAGCSVSIPLAGLIDNEPGGSVKRPVQVTQTNLPAALQPESQLAANSGASRPASPNAQPPGIDLAMARADEGLILHFDCNAGQGETLADSSGSKLDG